MVSWYKYALEFVLPKNNCLTLFEYTGGLLFMKKSCCFIFLRSMITLLSIITASQRAIFPSHGLTPADENSRI